jgi:hypothetical protein
MQCTVCNRKICRCNSIIDSEINEIGFVETQKRKKKITDSPQISLFRQDKQSEDKYKLKMLAAAKKRAEKKGLDFNLSAEDISIPTYCPVFGIPLYTSKLDSDNSPSIDRVDNLKGYVKENIQIISTRANRIKNDASLQELEQIVRYLKESI